MEQRKFCVKNSNVNNCKQKNDMKLPGVMLGYNDTDGAFTSDNDVQKLIPRLRN